MKGASWTPPEDDLLLKLVQTTMRWREIGDCIGRTANACQNRYELLVVRDGLERYVRPAHPKPTGERPEPKQNNCAKHLKLVAKANGGRGFPAYVLPPKYRVAA